MAKRPRMQAKPSRLHMALPLTSFRQNRREENRGSGRSWKREDSEQCQRSGSRLTENNA